MSIRNIVTVLLVVVTTFSAKASETKKALSDLGIELPEMNAPVANYVPAVRTGNLVFLAGAIAKDADGKFAKGKLGEDLSVEEGYEVARKVGVSLLAALLAEIGDLDKVVQFVKVEGFVNCIDGFEKQSLVINGASDLFVQVFGDKGKHARFAVGVNALPFGAPVEISAVVEVADEE
ncbi:RidA family protein [Puniceicoccaceae bacterium K14]|nr:RidA family protein [Puniceicoccaceae bacterium K14]